MKVEYIIEKDDYIEFNLDQLINSKDIKKVYFLQKAVVSFVFLFFIIYIHNHTDIHLYKLLIIYLIVLFIWIFIESKIFGFIIRKKLENEVRKNKEICGNKTLEIKGDGLYYTSQEAIFKTDWSDVKFLDESEDYIYIFVVSSPGYIIPKRSFLQEEDKNNFLSIIEKHIEYE